MSLVKFRAVLFVTIENSMNVNRETERLHKRFTVCKKCCYIQDSMYPIEAGLRSFVWPTDKTNGLQCDLLLRPAMQKQTPIY